MSYFKYAGTVSHGTMRAKDLIPRCLSVMKEIEEDNRYKQTGHPYEPFPYSEALKVLHNHFSLMQDQITEDWCESDDGYYYLFETLFDLLDNCAPDGYYFGSHPGDGSDYGFWSNELLD